jgi:ribosomal-protein-alanine N-acetyltransferase
VSRQSDVVSTGEGSRTASPPQAAATDIANLRTARLRLRRPRPEDLAAYVRMHQDPVVMATLGGVWDPAGTGAFFARILEHWTQHGFGWWTVLDLPSGRFAGRGGLRRAEVAGRHEVEVGYALKPEFWGRGLATELALASVEAAFQMLGLQALVCFTLRTNRASRRVMEKVGFRFEREGLHAGLPHVFCRLTAAEWRGAAQGAVLNVRRPSLRAFQKR